MNVTPRELAPVIGVSAQRIRQYLRDFHWKGHYPHMAWLLDARMVLAVCQYFGVQARAA